MGVQTLNEAEFNLLGRGHQFKDIMKSVEEINASNFSMDQVSIDLIMGLPTQTLDSYQRSIQRTADIGAGH